MFRYFKPRIKYFILYTAIFGVGLYFSMKNQLLQGNLLDGVMGRIDINFKSLALTIVLFLAISTVFKILFYKLIYSEVCRIYGKIKYDYFKSLHKKDLKTYYKLSKGGIIAEYTEQLNIVYRDYLISFANIFEKVLIIAVATITLYVINFELCIISLLLLSLPIIIPRLNKKRLSDGMKNYVEAQASHMKKVNTWLKTMDVIKNFHYEEKIVEQFNRLNEDYADFTYKKAKVMTFNSFLTFIGSNSASLILLAVSAFYVYRGIISPGQFFAIISIQSILVAPLFFIATFVEKFISSRVVCDRIINFIDEVNKDENKNRTPLTNDSDIVFHDVTFGYTEKAIIEGISLKFIKENKYLIKGSSGSGKSTIIRLMIGAFKPQRGSVTIGGRDVLELGDVFRIITLSHQDAFMFSGTLRENLAMGEEISDDEIYEVLNNLGLERLANPDALMMKIGGSDVNLSGGEKKRVGIARAILRKSEVLVLDEPLANIDPKNVGKIEDFILSIKDRTVIVISHEWSEDKLNGFDKSYEIVGGKIC